MNKNKQIKKLLSLDDLEKFYSKYKRSMHFSSKESGYQLAVQIPATFETDSNEDDTLFYGKIKAFHIGCNRNHSNVTEEAAKRAMKTMAYKPVLANFCDVELDDGTIVKDFTAHDMELDDDGNIHYIEHQIGCFTSDEPWIEHDDELDKDFVYAYVAIPRDYTDAVDIIERKNGTKVSVELLVNELSFNSKTKVMDLNDVIVSGICCLGTNPETGKAVEEGMLGSRLDIKDFSETNNSMFSGLLEDEHARLVDTLEKLNDTLSKISEFNINEETQEHYGKEDENVEKDEIKVEEEVTETEEVEVTTENESTEEVTDTTTENESEETVEVETPEVVEDEACKKKHEEESEEKTDEVIETESEETKEVESEEVVEEESEITEEEACGDKKKKYTAEFELSHDDVRCALYQLLESYCVSDNDWYWISDVYDDHFVYQGCMGNYFGQKYSKDGDNVAFDGERYELFAEFVTASEKAELESMRSNYSSIQEKLSAYELAEELADKATVFEDDAYANYLNTEEFKALMSEETMKQFSKSELTEKADAALGKLVKTNKVFSLNTAEKSVEKKPAFFAFAKTTEVNSSFLDGLLNK